MIKCFNTFYVQITNYYSEMSNLNRDINRQNKASSVIDASIYSFITKDKLDTLVEICRSVKNDAKNVLSLESRKRLEYAVDNLDTIGEADPNEQAAKNYMKCSTYIKGGARSIAFTEFKRMKRAIDYEETELLYDSCTHLTPHMVKLQESISSTPGKLPCSVVGTLVTSDRIPIITTPPNNTNIDMSNHTPTTMTPLNNTNIPSINAPINQIAESFNLDSNLDNFNEPIPLNIQIEPSTHDPSTIDPFNLDSNIDNFNVPIPINMTTFDIIPKDSSSGISTFHLTPPLHSNRYTPLQAVLIITSQSDRKLRKFYHLPDSNPFKITKTTKNTIIQSMIALNYIPIQTPTMFKLVREFVKTKKLRYLGWFDTTTSGKKTFIKKKHLEYRN